VEKRGQGRAKRRVMVRFGIQKADRAAFTRDLSETGLFIKSNRVFKPGTTLQIEMTFPDRTFAMWARVAWAKKVPPALAHVLECGMGVCFISPETDWIEYVRGFSQR